MKPNLFEEWSDANDRDEIHNRNDDYNENFTRWLHLGEPGA